jgi:hypothetical protein
MYAIADNYIVIKYHMQATIMHRNENNKILRFHFKMSVCSALKNVEFFRVFDVCGGWKWHGFSGRNKADILKWNSKKMKEKVKK